MKQTNRMCKVIPGNRFEVKIWQEHYQLWDKTLNRLIATSNNDVGLILFAEHNNMINADAVIIS